MKPRLYFTLVGILLIGILACDSKTTEPESVVPPSYSPLCAQTFPKDDDITLHIVYPKGGETFKVGQEIEIYSCEEDTSDKGVQALSSHGYELTLEIPGYAPVPIYSPEMSATIKGPRFKWTIPAILKDAPKLPNYIGVDVSPVTNQAKLIITQYEFGENHSESAIFKIVP